MKTYKLKESLKVPSTLKMANLSWIVPKSGDTVNGDHTVQNGVEGLKIYVETNTGNKVSFFTPYTNLIEVEGTPMQPINVTNLDLSDLETPLTTESKGMSKNTKTIILIGAGLLVVISTIGILKYKKVI